MGRRRLWALLAFLTTVSSGAVAGGQVTPPLNPVWRTDLRQVGFFASRGPSGPFRPWKESLPTTHSLAFGSGGHIAIAFLNQEIGNRAVSVENSRELQLVVLDATSGKIVAHRTWPSPWATEANEYVGANRDGDLMLLQGNKLRVFSPSLEEKNTLDLAGGLAGSGNWWSFSISPGGDWAFVQHFLNDRWMGQKMLSAITLREVRSWDSHDQIGEASGKYFVNRRQNAIHVRSFDTPWKQIADLNPCSAFPHGELNFVGDDLLLLSWCNPIQLIRADGQVLFAGHIPSKRLAADACAPSDGRYVAVNTTTTGGLGIALAFDMSSGRVPRGTLIYDTKTAKVVDSVAHNWRACVFSPDGSGLALLSGGIVELFSLP